MSCQQASRPQEDPYAFTESAPLPANTSLYKQPQQAGVGVVTSSSTSSSPVAPPSIPVIQAGTSLLANNNNNSNVAARLNHVVQQRTLLGTTAAKLAPIKVTLVQSPTGGILGKARLNGTTITSSPQGTVFRTVTVPQATTIVQRPIAPGNGSSSTTTTPTVFTKPLQVQISPQQAAAVAAAGGKFTARRILASKSPNVSPVTAATATAASVSGTHPTGIQTVRIVKTTPANVLQPVGAGARPTATIMPDGTTRRFLSHSGTSLLGSPVVVTTSVASGSSPQHPQHQQSPQQLPTISPTKIRLIQPQPQGKIFLHTPNSSNSLAAATHISNPISIAALRNSLAKQNPSLLNKIVVQQQQQHQQQPQAQPQQVQIAVSAGSVGTPSLVSNGLPTVRMIPTSTAVTAINIRRAVSAATVTTGATPPKRQMSLETATGTTTVMVPALAKPQAVAQAGTTPAGPVVVKQVKVIPATASAQSQVNRPPTIQIPQTLLQQRAKTPTQSILKPQPPRPQLQTTTVKTPQKLVIAASPKTTPQTHHHHPQQVMVLASPKSLGGQHSGQHQQQVMVVAAPKSLGAGGQQQVVVLAPFKPNQHVTVAPVTRTLTTSVIKPVVGSQQQQQQQQPQQILTSPVVKPVLKQQLPQHVVVSPAAKPQILTAPVMKQILQNQIVVKPPPQQPLLATSVAKTIQQRQIIATPVVAKPPQQQVVVTSVAAAKPTVQQPSPPQQQQVAPTSIVKPVQPPPQQIVLTPAPKPPKLQQPQAQPLQEQVPATIVATTPAPPPPPPVQQQQQPQDDFTIPSFIIPKQKEAKKLPEKLPSPAKPPAPVPVSVPTTPVTVPQPPPLPPPPVAAPVPPIAVTPPPIVPEPQVPSTSSTTAPVAATPKPKDVKAKESSSGKSSQKRAAKRSYSRSSHHETLERIDDSPAPAAAAAVVIPPMPKIHKWKPSGAVSIPVNREWHAPDSWIFDICPPGTRTFEDLENAPLTMDFWFEETYASSELDADLMLPRKAGGAAGRKRAASSFELPMDDGGVGGELVELAIEERSELRKAYMRRRAVQYWNAQRLRDPEPARKRLKAVHRVLDKLDKHREMVLSKNGGVELPKCQRPGCERDALLATTHCRQHIADNTEQRLFQRCTAKFSDNSQCQVPVFDISHELVLCREHAWKHDNHDKMSAEVRLLKKPTAPITAIAAPSAPVVIAKKKSPKVPIVKIVQPVYQAVPPASKSKNSKKKKKLTPFQQQMALHQQQYKQQYAVKPTLPPPPYPASAASQVVKQVGPSLYRQQSAGSLLQQQQHQPQVKYQQSTPPVQIVPPPSNRNVHIPLNQHQQHRQPQQTTLISYANQQQHMIGRNEDLMLNYQQQPQQQQQLQAHQQQQYTQQQVQQQAVTQDLLNICENSSAYASSEDTGVGGLSESELMAAQDVIEEIPFEIGNVLSQLPPDAFNELLFSEQEQNGPTYESTREEEEDLERALEVVGEHVKSLEDMTVESANLFGDFLDNVDDDVLDGSDICSDQMLVVQSPGGPNDIRGLVHT